MEVNWRCLECEASSGRTEAVQWRMIGAKVEVDVAGGCLEGGDDLHGDWRVIGG